MPSAYGRAGPCYSGGNSGRLRFSYLYLWCFECHCVWNRFYRYERSDAHRAAMDEGP